MPMSVVYLFPILILSGLLVIAVKIILLHYFPVVSTTTTTTTSHSHCNGGEEDASIMESTGTARRRPCSACCDIDPSNPFCIGGRCTFNNLPAAACLNGQCLSTPYCDEEDASFIESAGTARRRPCSACIEEDACRPWCQGGRCTNNNTPHAACTGNCSHSPYL